ncbi:Mobile element protein [Candidatus Enterovibrio escicola]|uniref:Mobile element protein n=1 Tax=Candidatus Enterovibrio escicola TaxID=1927127 RepID=A0A2A5T1L0_9GAMM|nr:Mobile element protein [Candidatus Enterovibrio escacola]
MVAHIIINDTGLKVYGESKGKLVNTVMEKRCIWRKLHLAVDVSTHEVIAAAVSIVSVGNNEI